MTREAPSAGLSGVGGGAPERAGGDKPYELLAAAGKRAWAQWAE